MQAKILVVDDEPDLEHLIRQKFRREIRSRDFEFVFAQNGVQAINHLTINDDFDLVLTDINMPEMDGLTLLSKIDDMNKLLKSVIVSAYGDMDNIRTAMNRGAFDFITKPIDLKDLETTINKSLREVMTLKEALKSRDELVAIQRELSIATEIQTSILPKTFPAFPEREEFDIYAQMITAKEVGGDFYDYFLIDEDHLGMIIGDVSGKGVPAAMLMAVSRTLLRVTALKGVEPNRCLHEVNNVLVDETVPHMFVTVFYGVLNARTGDLTYCNGGHNPPYVIGAEGSIKQVENIGGVFLGGIKDLPYESKTITLQPNDALFLYTDGITEAQDADESDFEDHRLEACLRNGDSLPPKEIIETVLAEVNEFSRAVPQSDDMTCLGLRFHGKRS